MKEIRWSDEKNALNMTMGRPSFEVVAEKLRKGEVLALFDPHPTRDNQKAFVIEINNDTAFVSFVEEEDYIFLKNAWISRKYRFLL